MAEADAPVDLDSLTKKQLAKQFKSVAKEIKSKDLEVKTNVLAKLTNHRYFFEGGCLPPFFESLTPKKKTLEMCKMTLESLLEFLRGGDDESCPNGRRALTTLRSSVGGLACLEQLGACNAYHEVPKKAKKGQPPNTEDENAIQLRTLSSTALFELTRALNASPFDAHLVRQFSDVPNIIPHLSQGLKCLMPLFENEESRGGCIGQLSNVLYCLSTAMSRAHAPALMACGGAATVLALLKDPKLTVYCLDIFYKIILHPDGFAEWAIPMEYRRIYLGTLRRSVEDLVAAVGVGAADAPPAKDAKGGKAAKPAKGADPNAAAAEATAKADENRALAAQIQLLSQMFLIMSTAEASPLTPEEIGEVSELLTSVVLNTELWKLCNTYVPSSRVPNVSLEGTVAIICSVLGSFGLREDSRDVVCSHNAIEALGSVLLKSRMICDVPGDGETFLPEGFEASEENFIEKRIRVRKAQALLSLRRVAEKSLLHILTRRVEEAPPRVNKAYHWTACDGQVVTSVTSEEGTRAAVARLVDAVVSADTDLAGRVVRLLSSVIQCAASAASAATSAEYNDEGNDEDPAPVEELRTILGIDNPAVATNLGKFVSERARSFHRVVVAGLEEEHAEGENVSPMESNRKAALNHEAETIGVSVQELLFFKWEEAERRGLRDQKWRPDTVDVLDGEVVQTDENVALLLEESQAEAADFLFLAVDEALTHGLYLLSDILVVSADVVKSASSTDLVEALVDVLRVAGPTPGAFARRKEHMVSLYDPRIYNWREEHDHRNEEYLGLFSMIALRGLGASVLANIAEADAKYRSYDGEIPCAPGTAAPVSTSAGYQPASLVCKLASDVCISSLMVSSRLHFGAAGDLTCGPDTVSTCTLGITEPSHARRDVTDSFLELATAISSCGLVGLASCYESLANSQTDSPHYSTSLSALVSCLQSDFAAGGEFTVEGDNASELLAAPVDWTFPLHFNYFESECANLPTSKGRLLYRKDLWPLIAASSAIIGVISDPRSSGNTVDLAVRALKNFSKVATMQDVNQPAVADLFSAVFVAMGGGTALLSSLSCFGILSSCTPEAKSNATEMLVYLIGRGTQRQTHWDKVLTDKLNAEREAAAAADAAGGKGKKDDKKGGGKDDKKNDKGKKGAVTEEERIIDVPIQPDDSNSDPNYGPSADVWAILLNMNSDCFFCRSEGVSPLSCYCQGVLSLDIYDDTAAVLSALLSAGVDLNKADGAGKTPLMYALAVGSRSLVQALLDAGASPDTIDSNGTPTIEYAFLSICTESLNTSLLDLVIAERRMMWDDVDLRNEKSIVCNGTCDCLTSLLEAGIDLKVSKLADGNFPLHFACGIAQLDLTIGGVRFTINNTEYSTNFSRLNTAATVQALIDHGASPKSCNKTGVLPIHIAAASGDVASVELCLCTGGGDLANTADNQGYLPLHYAAACCPRHAFEVINSLLKWGDLRPLGEANYQDHRTALSLEDKYWHDVEDAMTTALSFGDEHSAVSNHRVTKKEIVRTLTKTGLSPLHLVLAGRSLSVGHLSRLMSPWDNVGVRVAVAEMFCEIGSESVLVPPTDADGEVSTSGLSPVHALALLGVEPKKPNAFHAGSLSVSAVSTSDFTPDPAQSTHVLSVKLVHGSSEINTPAMMSSSGTLLWNLSSSSLLEVDSAGSDLLISVWAAEVEGGDSKCIGCGSLSLGMIGRGQLLVGEEISLTALVVSSATATPCGSVSVVLRTVCDVESSVGTSGPIFSCQDFFTRILKSVNNDASMCSSVCSWPMAHCRLPEQWTPLHACIVSQNRILATALIGIKVKAGVAWSDTPYLNFVAQSCNNNTFCSVLIDAYAKLKASALNRASNDEYPLHAAVRYKNIALVNALVDCPKVNLNAIDSTTGATAFLEACRVVKVPKESDLYAAFERNADRLDFLIADNNGETCIDFAVRNNVFDLVEGLCEMRRNDVVERITSNQGEHGEGALLALETANIKLTKIVHATLFEEKLPDPVVKKTDSEEEEEEYAIDTADKFPSHASVDTANRSEQNQTEEEAEDEKPTTVETDSVPIEEAITQLADNERMLSILLKCVISSGVAPSLEFHLHECYATGQLFREYHEKLNVSGAGVVEATGGVEAVNLGDANAHTAENANGNSEADVSVPETGDNDVGDNCDRPETKIVDENRDIPPSKELGSFDGVNSSNDNLEVE